MKRMEEEGLVYLELNMQKLEGTLDTNELREGNPNPIYNLDPKTNPIYNHITNANPNLSPVHITFAR